MPGTLWGDEDRPNQSLFQGGEAERIGALASWVGGARRAVRPPDDFAAFSGSSRESVKSAVSWRAGEAGDVVVIRAEGPVGGPGMREMLAEVRHAAAKAVEVGERPIDAGLARDRHQVQHR